MSEHNVLERNGEVFHGVEGPRSVSDPREPGVEFDQQDVTARARFPQEEPAAKAPASTYPPEAVRPEATDREHRDGFLRRRPVVSVIGAMLLASAIVGGYLYLDYARHFESTDDAFIAARQFSIASKVSGYITAVPVTDNQHVKAGDVIARIDDRDFRTALEQAQAQVAAAQANIENIDAQLDVQQAQISTNQAQVDQAQAGLVFAQQQAERFQHLEHTGYGTVQNAQQFTSQLHQQQAALLSAQATLKLANRQVELLKAQRKSADCQPRAGPGPARPGATQSLLHDGDGGPAGACRRPERCNWSIRPARQQPDHVCAGSDLGDSELQGESTRPDAAGRSGDARD